MLTTMLPCFFKIWICDRGNLPKIRNTSWLYVLVNKIKPKLTPTYYHLVDRLFLQSTTRCFCCFTYSNSQPTWGLLECIASFGQGILWIQEELSKTSSLGFSPAFKSSHQILIVYIWVSKPNSCFISTIWGLFTLLHTKILIFNWDLTNSTFRG